MSDRERERERGFISVYITNTLTFVLDFINGKSVNSVTNIRCKVRFQIT